MRLRRLLPLLCLALAVSPRPAFADATLFIGTTNVSDSANASRQTTKGFAIGAGLLVVGIEFEYAQTGADEERLGPSLRTGVGNVDIQKPGFTSNTGGGVKISLLGPLKARVDYRIFKLLGDKPSPTWRGTVQRLYAGVSLGF